MARKTSRILVIFLLLIIVLGIASFISYSKFNVLNPFSTVSGLIQILFTDKEYVEIQKDPKVIIAKPNASLQEYMGSLGFQEDKENRFGSLLKFKNNNTVHYIMYSVNEYFSKWIWEKIETEIKKIEAIPFHEDQLYAVAFLGYTEINDLSYYIQKYLDSENIPIHYISQGEYYLIVPRYSNMSLSLYRNDFDTMESILIFEEKECRPFILQCNVSDIFPDATIRFIYNDETIEFSPYISLKDGTVVVGDRGLDITK